MCQYVLLQFVMCDCLLAAFPRKHFSNLCSKRSSQSFPLIKEMFRHADSTVSKVGMLSRSWHSATWGPARYCAGPWLGRNCRWVGTYSTYMESLSEKCLGSRGSKQPTPLVDRPFQSPLSLQKSGIWPPLFYSMYSIHELTARRV